MAIKTANRVNDGDGFSIDTPTYPTDFLTDQVQAQSQIPQQPNLITRPLSVHKKATGRENVFQRQLVPAVPTLFESLPRLGDVQSTGTLFSIFDDSDNEMFL